MSNFNTVTNSKGYKISMMVVSILMLIAIIIMGVFLGMYTSDRKGLRSDIENIYQQAYYTLLESNVRIENNLSKLSVISSPRLIEDTLESVTRDCEKAGCAVNTMTTGDESLRTVLGYYNQLGDYHSYLLRLVKKSGELSSGDYKTIASFAERSRIIGKQLSAMQDKISNGYKFIELLGSEDDPWNDMIGEINTGNYPSLIYDGPFSDGVNDREAKGVHGDEISQEQATEIAKKYLVGYNIIDINPLGQSQNRIPSFLIEAELNGERTATVQIAAKGGMLLMLDVYKAVTEPMRSAEECVLIAEQYCDKIGLPNMKGVWINNNSSIAYINLCYVQDGVILYPDMVKVKVAMDTGEVVGFEGLNYAFNHTTRELPSATISEKAALESVNSGLTQLTARLTLIPLTQNSEMLCYEISGFVGEERYFIYVDVMTGDEVRILRVIDSNQGELLM